MRNMIVGHCLVSLLKVNFITNALMRSLKEIIIKINTWLEAEGYKTKEIKEINILSRIYNLFLLFLFPLVSASGMNFDHSKLAYFGYLFPVFLLILIEHLWWRPTKDI